MINLEAYKDELAKNFRLNYAVNKHNNHVEDCFCFPCKDCLFGGNEMCDNSKARVDWLLEEYKEQILDDSEKAYLLNIIKPFKEKIISICKRKTTNGLYYIQIYYKGKYNTPISLPPFKRNTKMYENMKINILYNLEQLDL